MNKRREDIKIGVVVGDKGKQGPKRLPDPCPKDRYEKKGPFLQFAEWFLSLCKNFSDFPRSVQKKLTLFITM